MTRRDDMPELGFSPEELAAIGAEWGCSADKAAELLAEAAASVESLRAGHDRRPELPAGGEAELEQLADRAGVEVDELVRTASEWEMGLPQTAQLLEERRLRPPPSESSSSRRRPMREPQRVVADATAIVSRAQSGTRAAAMDQALGRGLQHLPRPAGRPPGASYRSQVVRRVSDPLSPPLWFFRFGAHASQVQAWLGDWRRLDNPVERAIVSCLRAEMYRRSDEARRHCRERGTQRGAPRSGFAAIFPVASLAFQLWFDSRQTTRAGYSAHVQGVPRGELARRMAHKVGGVPVDPDTVSRYLVELGRILGGGRVPGTSPASGGILEWHQPEPGEAVKEGLHKSTHFLADGTRQVQATNHYWWRNAEWVVKSGFDPARLEAMFKGERRDLPDGSKGEANAAIAGGARIALEKMHDCSSSVRFARAVDLQTGHRGDKQYSEVTVPSGGVGSGGAVSCPTGPTSSGGLQAASVPPVARGQPP